MSACTRLAVLIAVLGLARLGCCQAAAANAAQQHQQQQRMQQLKRAVPVAAAVPGAAVVPAEQQWQQQQQQQLQQPSADQDLPDQDDAAATLAPANPGSSITGSTLAGPASTGDADVVQASTPEQADPLDQSVPNSEIADLNDAINELLDSSSTVDPKPYGNRAPDASDLPSHQGRKRCGTPAGSTPPMPSASEGWEASIVRNIDRDAAGRSNTRSNGCSRGSSKYPNQRGFFFQRRRAFNCGRWCSI